MREIKFRGKRLDNGKWIYGSLMFCHGPEGCSDHHAEIRVYTQYEEYKHGILWASWDDYEVNATTVGQYSGLKDKNGKEIWEGDIFKEDISGIVRSVFRVPGGLAFEDNPVSFGYDHRAPVYPYSSIAEMQNASWLSQCCEIIGNVHDTPELLKGGER